jgi:hypothetical protein
MTSPRKATKPPVPRKVPDLNQEVANALGASTGVKIPKPKPAKSEQARGPQPQ